MQTRDSCHEKFNGYFLDLHNHARWTTAHLFDLMALCSTCPNVYTQFLKWKNKRRQWSHAFIKLSWRVGVGKMGDVHYRNCENYWIRTKYRSENYRKPYYEGRSAFQRNFAEEVRKVYHGFEVNSFEEINLVNISNHLYLVMKKQESH